MILKINIKKLLFSLLPPIVAGGLAALITRGDMDLYKTVEKPPFSPPAIVFPIVWSVLYILMGVSFYLVWNERNSYYEKRRAFIFYFAGLFFNFLWSPVFFTFRQFAFAFIILVLLFVCVAIYTALFAGINKTAALLQIPYIIWLIIAAYLNVTIALMN